MIQSDKNKNKVFDRGEWRFPERKKKSQKNGTSNGSNEPGHKMMESSTLQAKGVYYLFCLKGMGGRKSQGKSSEPSLGSRSKAEGEVAAGNTSVVLS